MARKKILHKSKPTSFLGSDLGFFILAKNVLQSRHGLRFSTFLLRFRILSRFSILFSRIKNLNISTVITGTLSALLFSFIFSALNLYFNPTPTYAHTASITTRDEIILDLFPNNTTVHNESVEVDTTCSDGYYLALATSASSVLYKDGNPANLDGSINPVNPNYALNDSTNNSSTWGFSLDNTPSVVGAFNPLSTTPTTIKTPSETAVPSGSISDIFSIYYGINLPHSTPPGSYYMANSGKIVYQLTMAESCFDSLVISFDENAGSDTVTNMPTNEDNTYDLINKTVTLSTKRPVRSGYIFTSWNTSADGTGTTYTPGETVPIGAGGLSGFVDLYAVWVAECASGYICYDGNGADEGTMNPQAITGTGSIALIASNFSRSGYGFMGWNTQPDGTGTQYGPNQNFPIPSSGGVNLFAKWVKSSGTLQIWNGASNMNTGDVIALKDSRDNEVYTVAKLADNNIWITENLRLVPNTSNITAINTNGPTQDFLDAYPSSSSSTVATGQCSTDDSTCVDQIRFNAHNLDRTLTPAYDGATNDTYWYSYGVMYNWYTATAGNGTYNLTSSSAEGDLCPAGWHLPTGGSSGEWGILADSMTGSTKVAKAATLRAYPNNFLWSGDYNPSKDIPDGVGKQGRIWSTTPVSNNIKNAYRMGYNSSEITATTNSWNKWDNFAIRCIYQGGNIPFSDTTVSFAGTGITSVTFTSENLGTVTATPNDPTIQLAQNEPYTITAITSAGYELSSWATTSGGTLGSTTANPTTYLVTGDTILTATGSAIPSYTTTVSFGSHTTSVTFSNPDYSDQTVTTDGGTVLLKQGIPYTITATYEEGYTLDYWSTTSAGTITDLFAPSTTYTITNDTTLTVNTKVAELLEYTLHYDAGTGGIGAPADDEESSYHNEYIFSINTTSIPNLFGYHFTGYSETPGQTTPTYVYNSTTNTFTPSSITVITTGHSTTKTLYAVYAEDTCPANRICYFDNGADSTGGGIGTMNNQIASSSSSATLIPSNYSKSGYGFAGWQVDGGNPGDPTNNIPATPPVIYGPNETITTPDISSSGLKLYAKWVESAGNLQGWNGCNSLSQGAVTALTDTRDNNTYAVAKLADDNCWLIENFRLDPATTTITAMNTHNPTPTFITKSQAGSGSSLSSNTLCNTNDATCFDQLQYNTNSSKRNLTQTHNTDGNDVAWYAYGTYYNWYTATAGNGTYSTTSTSGPGGDGTVAGDICPLGWHLPSGNTKGEYNALNTAINNGATNSDANWRKYPNNFVWSGDYNNVKRNSSYSNGRLWTATAKDNSTTYRIGYKTNEVTARTNTFNKWDGFIVRCIKDAQEVTFSDVTVTIPTGLDSITFQNSQYGEQTATAENPTVPLAQEATYTITANESMGYEFASWTTGQNATLGGSSQNPTTLTITDDSTLTATTTTRPSYQTTVTIDSGVTSVSFYNTNYGIQTATSSNPIVSLREGVEYTITGSYATGYEFSSWATSANGTLGDATSATTTYTVTGTATLSVTTAASGSSNNNNNTPTNTNNTLNTTNLNADTLSSLRTNTNTSISLLWKTATKF